MVTLNCNRKEERRLMFPIEINAAMAHCLLGRPTAVDSFDFDRLQVGDHIVVIEGRPGTRKPGGIYFLRSGTEPTHALHGKVYMAYPLTEEFGHSGTEQLKRLVSGVLLEKHIGPNMNGSIIPFYVVSRL